MMKPIRIIQLVRIQDHFSFPFTPIDIPERYPREGSMNLINAVNFFPPPFLPLLFPQQLLVLVLFIFMIYVVAMEPSPLSALTCILLMVLSGVYVFIVAVDVINYLSRSSPLHVIPVIRDNGERDRSSRLRLRGLGTSSSDRRSTAALINRVSFQITVFSFLGFVLFTIAWIILVCTGHVQLVMEIVTVTMCAALSLIYLIDLMMVLA